MMGDFDIDDENEDGNITINGVPYCAMITDLIFEKSEEELLSMSLTKPYEKYFAIQKECYIFAAKAPMLASGMKADFLYDT